MNRPPRARRPAPWRRCAHALLLGAAALAGLGACSTPGAPPLAVDAAGADDRLPPPLAKGVRALENGDPAAASRLFNDALNRQPNDARLHTLNALAYHLMVARGEGARFDLAEAGYQVARQLDPGNLAATRLLARLYLEAQRYREAQALYAEAILIAGESPDSLQGLASASYYRGDLALALWAAERLQAVAADGAPAWRTSALVYAAAGDRAGAERALERFDDVEDDDAARRRVHQRVRQWGQVRTAWDADEARAQSKTETGTDVRPEAKTTADAPAPMPPIAPAAAIAAPEPGAGAWDDRAALEDGKPLAPYWADCQQDSTRTATTTASSYGSYGYSSSSSGYGYSSYGYGARMDDDTEPLPALPSPCTGRPPPRMVQVDATLIRTDDDIETGKGINILDGLAVVLTGANTRTRLADAAGEAVTRVWSRGLALPESGIRYALNMFNVTQSRAQVLARPSLLALDRQPSRFFSGANITVAISGQYSANLEEKPVGVSLSVTPTFVDDDTVLLAVKVSRSFFETSQTGASFQQQVQTSKNSVTASVLARFDQTVVISGLNERQFITDDNGVPLLRDIPAVQYLFARQTERSFNHNILILLTPRRPSGKGGGDAGQQTDDATDALRQRLDGLRITPNLAITLDEMENNRLFKAAFRSNDLAGDNWARMGVLQRTIREVIDFLYF